MTTLNNVVVVLVLFVLSFGSVVPAAASAQECSVSADVINTRAYADGSATNLRVTWAVRLTREDSLYSFYNVTWTYVVEYSGLNDFGDTEFRSHEYLGPDYFSLTNDEPERRATTDTELRFSFQLRNVRVESVFADTVRCDPR